MALRSSCHQDIKKFIEDGPSSFFPFLAFWHYQLIFGCLVTCYNKKKIKRKYFFTEDCRLINANSSIKLESSPFCSPQGVICVLNQSCPVLCDPLDCSPPSLSVHGILQARILECVAIFLLQGNLPDPGIKATSPVSLRCRQILTYSAIQEGKKKKNFFNYKIIWKVVKEQYILRVQHFILSHMKE